jgi:hypothetical protein
MATSAGMLVVVGSESRERKPVIVKRRDFVENSFDGLDAAWIYRGARRNCSDEAECPASAKRHDAAKPDEFPRLAISGRRIVER